MNETQDDLEELQQMAEFYSKNYDEVYFVRDLQAGYIVAVECFPARSGLPTVMRNKRKMNCFGYKERLLSSRERIDLTPMGKPMVGYESISGNDTRLGECEDGLVGVVAATPGVAAGQSLGASSPFERAQLEADVRAAQESSGKAADYELAINKDGMTIERFETFAVERKK